MWGLFYAILFIFFLNMNVAHADATYEQQDLKFLAVSPESETRAYKIECREDSYELVLLNRRRGIELETFTRDGKPVGGEVVTKLAALLFDFWGLKEVTILCGAGDGGFVKDRLDAQNQSKILLASSLKIIFTGKHKADLSERRERCERINGIFLPETSRHVYIQRDEIEINRKALGACSTLHLMNRSKGEQ